MLKFSISLPLTLAALAVTLAARALMPSASPANHTPAQPSASQIIGFENEPETQLHENHEFENELETKSQTHGNPEPETYNLIYGDAEAYPNCPVCK